MVELVVLSHKISQVNSEKVTQNSSLVIPALIHLLTLHVKSKVIHYKKS